MLSDEDICAAIALGEIAIDPFDDAQHVQPASIDLHLGDEIGNWSMYLPTAIIDPSAADPIWPEMNKVILSPEEGGLLPPNTFVLGTTKEVIRLGPAHAARVEGRSTLGRLGLMVHSTAGFIDPGFEGTITLELYNLSPFAFRLRPGMSICQLAFSRLETPAAAPYGSEGVGSKYQGQHGVKLPVARKGKI